MTMGLSMALHEQSVVDPRFGHVVNHDLAEYHIATCADVADLQAHRVDEDDPHVNALGSKGIGEIGIVGTAAAVANALWHATGVRVRDLPLTLEMTTAAAPSVITARFSVAIDGYEIAAFSELVGITAEVESSECWETSGTDVTVNKVAGKLKPPTVVLKRGMNGSLELWSWHEAVRAG